MGKPAIIVENLSKRYFIEGALVPHMTLGESMMGSAKRFGNLICGKSTERSVNSEAHWALRDISFRVEQGEVWGFIGNNGAGKSTLLKVLSRITPPTSGTAKIYGRLGSLLEVGTGFHQELTGRENIFLNGSILGMRHHEIQQKFDEIVDFAQIEKFLDTPVKHYSSGMYVRLAFSVAAHLEPEILVIDEVLAVGDVRFQKKCLGKMQDVARSGRTVLFVSHNIPTIRNFCQKGVFLEEGHMRDIGPIDQVLNSYLSSFGDSGASTVFEACERPGNKEFNIHSIRLKDSYGNPIDSVHLSEEAVVEIVFETLCDDAQASFALTLMSQDGACVFSSLSNQEQTFYGKPMKRGIYTTECRLYPHLLNNGRFYATLVGIGSFGAGPFAIEKAISFEALDDGVLKGDYQGMYGGCVRPKLEWNTARSELLQPLYNP